MATTVRARAPVMPTVRWRSTGSRAASTSGPGNDRRASPGARCVEVAVGGDEAGREHPTRGERHVLAEHDEHRGLERVGAAGHPQVRPGPHQRPEHRVVGERGDAAEPGRRRAPPTGGRLRPPTATASGRPSTSTPGCRRRPAGSGHGEQRRRRPAPATSRRCRLDPSAAPRRRRARARRAPRGSDAAPRRSTSVGGHPAIKPHARGSPERTGQVFECRLGWHA